MSGYRLGYASGYEQALRDLFLARQKSPACHYRRVGHHLWAWRKAVLDPWAGRQPAIHGEDTIAPEQDAPPGPNLDLLAAELTAEARRAQARRRRQPKVALDDFEEDPFHDRSIMSALLGHPTAKRRRG